MGKIDRKIKVVHIITKLELGGAQGNTLYTVANLDKNRFDAVLVAGRGGILDKEAGKMRSRFARNLVRQISPISDLKAYFEIKKILREEAPDIVHTHSSKAGIIGRWAAHTAGVPVVIHTFHGFGFNDFQNIMVRGIYVFLEKLTAKITEGSFLCRTRT